MQLFRNYTKTIPKDKRLLAGGSFLSHSNKIWLSNSQHTQCPHKQKREKPRDELFFPARRGFCKTNRWAGAESGLSCKPAVPAWSPAGTSAPAPPPAASSAAALRWAEQDPGGCGHGQPALGTQGRSRGGGDGWRLHSPSPPSQLLAPGSRRFMLPGAALH